MKITQWWFNKKQEVSIPRWYGRAYSEYCFAADVYYPIPIRDCILQADNRLDSECRRGVG